jgi:hypothetical protein
VNPNLEPLTDALQRMPVPPPRAGFVDDVLARATAGSDRPQRASRLAALGRWETWLGAAVGAAVAAMATILIMPPQAFIPSDDITLALNESRNIEVLIDSERALDDATVRVAASGSVELDGFEDRHEVRWQTSLERGRNVLSLPVVARSAGAAQLVAVIEHDGRSRRVAVRLLVKDSRGDGVVG